jgi:hypothetical protein
MDFYNSKDGSPNPLFHRPKNHPLSHLYNLPDAQGLA